MKAFAIVLTAWLLPMAAVAQTLPSLPQIKSADGKVTARAQPIQCVDNLGRGSSCGSPQEAVQLVAANTPSAPATMFGGDYILSQTCSSYGTLTLQARGPDGASYVTLLTKSSSDTAGGTGLALGSFAVVRITVTGTAGCNAILARVPA